MPSEREKERALRRLEMLRPHVPWNLVLRRVRQADPLGSWTKPRLVRAVKGLASIGLTDGERLLGRAKPLPPDGLLPKLVASIMRARPDITVRGVAAELEALGERTPRGGRSWSPSSAALQIERARRLGLMHVEECETRSAD